MAIISKIRQNSWLLIVAIALGMGGFLLMDMFSSNQGAIGTSNTVGKIDGKKISIQEFFNREQELYSNSGGDPFQRRAALWEYYVQETILTNEAEKLGIGVSDEELNELFQVGPRLSPVVVNDFGGYQQFDQQSYNEVLRNLGNLQPEQRRYWKTLEDRVIVDRLGQKITNLVTSAVYTPTWLAEMSQNETSQKVDFRFVGIPYASIDDSEVKVTDSDLKSYIKRHDYKYSQDEETRVIDYVVFTVTPSAEDSAKLRTKFETMVPEFAAAEEDSLFITNNYGTFDPAYFTKEQLSPAIADTLLEMPIGSVYGPYFEGNQYKITKLVDRKIIPDSVKARHILLPVQNPADFVTINNNIKTLDSLKTVLENGTESFDSLAAKFGTDGTRDKGGDLGFAAPGSYVKPFNDLVFYEAEVGELNIVTTEFGVHLVEVTNVKKSDKVGVQYAQVAETLLPSTATQGAMRNKAFAFVANNRTIEDMATAANEDPDLTVVSTTGLKKNDFFIGGLGSGDAARNMIKWVYDRKTKKGEVAKDIYTFSHPVDLYDEKYVIAAYKSRRDAGLADLESVRLEVERLAINEKKAEIIKKQITSSNLDEVATQFGSTVQTASGVAFNQESVSGMGREPKAIAKAFMLDLNQVSEPIEGITGVFLVEPTYKPEATPVTDIVAARQQVSSPIKNQVTSTLFDALKKKTDIVDNRNKFY